MKKTMTIAALVLLTTGTSFAQELFTNNGVVGMTIPAGLNTNVGIGPGFNNPLYQLHVFAPPGANGVSFDVDNFLYGAGNAVMPGTYSGAHGQNNQVINNSNECFAFGLNNTIDNTLSSFAAGYSHTIMNSAGSGGCIALGGGHFIDNTFESAAIGEANEIHNGHASISLGGHNYNDGDYTFTIGSSLNNSITNSIMLGFGSAAIFVENSNNVGIGTTTPQELFHVAGTIRSDDLIGGGNVCADANGNLFISGICGSGGISNSCTNINVVPKVIDAAGNLGCSQIFDDGLSVGIGTTGPFGYTWAGGLTGPTLPPAVGTVRLDVNGVTRALAYIATSDRNMKTDIQNISDAGSILSNISGKTYHWNQETLDNTKAADVKQYGFIAQEVAEVLPEAVSVDETGKYGVNYLYFIPLLTEAYKDQQTEIEDLKAQISELKAANGSSTGTNSNDGNTGATLEQNHPNPFNTQTQIRMNLPASTGSAEILVFNLEGVQIKRIPVSGTGDVSITIQASELEAGMYIYTLITDGKVISSKQMILTK